MKQAFVLFLLIATIGFGQDWNHFSGEERAFLYHQTRRTEVLRLELFNLFEYTDSIPYINDTLPDYSFVERQIVADPDLLQLHSAEIPRQSVGVVMDLATRYALWELDRVLHFRNSTAEADKPLKERLKRFERLVIEEAPQKAVRTITSGEYVLVKNIDQYFAPSLTVCDKLAAILNSSPASLKKSRAPSSRVPLLTALRRIFLLTLRFLFLLLSNKLFLNNTEISFGR